MSVTRLEGCAGIGLLALALAACGARPVTPAAAAASVADGGSAAAPLPRDAAIAVAGDAGTGGELPPPCGWDCTAEEPRICRLSCGPHDGLPPGGARWECHLVRRWLEPAWSEAVELEWLCYGEVPTGAPAPGGGGWRCERFDFPRPGRDVYRCTKADEERDHPPGTTPWPQCKMERGARCSSCEKGSAVGGTVCRLPDMDAPPASLLPAPCEPGATYWCDDAMYSGWGQVTCKDDGTFPTRLVNGKRMLDCTERADGRRPDTICACYHFYFNPACCERSDCRVPPGTAGQLCPTGSGAPCSHCNPQRSECAGGGVCAVSNRSESFCVAPCAPMRDLGDSRCPAGTACMDVKHRTEVGAFCVPEDLGCYW